MTKQPKNPNGSQRVYYDSILGDISKIIDAARKSAVRSVNLPHFPAEQIYATLSRKLPDEISFSLSMVANCEVCGLGGNYGIGEN